MTIARRRSLSIAVCIASVSLIAAQPALAGSKANEAASTPTVEQQQEALTTFVQKIVQFLKDLQQQKSETTTTTIKRG